MIYDETLYIFEPPFWRRLADPTTAIRSIRAVLSRYADISDTLTTAEYKELYHSLLTDPDLEVTESVRSPAGYLNCSDGTVELSTMQVLPHSPSDHFFSYVDIPCERILRPAMSGHAFESFAYRAGDGNPSVRTQLLELIGLTLFGLELKYFYVLLGPSHTGKSQFLRFLTELVGRENVESVAGVHDFANRFTTSALAGKLLGTCSDLPDTPLPTIAVGVIKQFVGDDPIKIEQKYKDSKTIYRKPVLVFAGNHAIRIPNAQRESAFLNRMIVIPFLNPVSEDEMRQHLYEELLAEAPYIIHQAILAYQDLLNRNFSVTRSELPSEYQHQNGNADYQGVSNFAEQCVLSREGAYVATQDLYEAFCAFASTAHLPELNAVTFSRLFSETTGTMFPSAVAVKRVPDTQQRGYRNLCLVP